MIAINKRRSKHQTVHGPTCENIGILIVGVYMLDVSEACLLSLAFGDFCATKRSRLLICLALRCKVSQITSLQSSKMKYYLSHFSDF